MSVYKCKLYKCNNPNTEEEGVKLYLTLDVASSLNNVGCKINNTLLDTGSVYTVFPKDNLDDIGYTYTGKIISARSITENNINIKLVKVRRLSIGDYTLFDHIVCIWDTDNVKIASKSILGMDILQMFNFSIKYDDDAAVLEFCPRTDVKVFKDISGGSFEIQMESLDSVNNIVEIDSKLFNKISEELLPPSVCNLSLDEKRQAIERLYGDDTNG